MGLQRVNIYFLSFTPIASFDGDGTVLLVKATGFLLSLPVTFPTHPENIHVFIIAILKITSLHPSSTLMSIVDCGWLCNVLLVIKRFCSIL